MNGFKYYDKLPSINPTYMTPEQAIASATLTQVQAYIDWYVQGVDPGDIKSKYFINRQITNFVYSKFKQLENLATSLMCGEIEGIKIVPKSIDELKLVIANILPKFKSEWIGLVVDAIVKCSKHDGTGDWAFYVVNVVK